MGKENKCFESRGTKKGPSTLRQKDCVMRDLDGRIRKTICFYSIRA